MSLFLVLFCWQILPKSSLANSGDQKAGGVWPRMLSPSGKSLGWEITVVKSAQFDHGNGNSLTTETTFFTTGFFQMRTPPTVVNSAQCDNGSQATHVFLYHGIVQIHRPPTVVNRVCMREAVVKSAQFDHGK